MDIKKIFLTGSCAAAMGVFSACSDDSASANDEVLLSSSSVVMITSTDSEGNPVQVPVSSATSDVSVPKSSGSNVLVSSSSLSETDDPQMACSEIMYNADGSDLEWVEIYIAGGSDMDNMVNYELHLSGSVDYTFPEGALKKGEYVVVTNDLAKFAETYPTFAGRVFGPFVGKLPNEGDVVNVKVRGEGDVTCAFSSEPPWPSLADGKGRTLVYKGGIAAQAQSWCASAAVNGVPGVGGDKCIDVVNSVRINEIKPYASDADHSWMELYNSGAEAVDVSGWSVTVKRRNQTVKINAGVVPAGGYLVLDGVTDFDSELIVSNQGGELYLRGLVEGQESSIWVPASNGTSGVVDLEDGSTAQGPMAEATPGAKNSVLKRGSLYIDEIHYHPDGQGSLPFEFLELVNSTDENIVPYSTAVQRGWKVEGVNIEFTALDTIPAHGRVLLIPENLEDVVLAGWGPSLVRSSYGIAPEVKILTYKGKLSNRGETIAVKEPFAKEGTGADIKYFYIWHDATLYSDAWAGLEEADGYGFSLQRTDATTMGYNPSAWKAAEPTIGK